MSSHRTGLRTTVVEHPDQSTKPSSKRRRLDNASYNAGDDSEEESLPHSQPSSPKASPQFSPSAVPSKPTNGTKPSSTGRRSINFSRRKSVSVHARDFLDFNSGFKMKVMTPDEIRAENDAEETESPQPGASNVDRAGMTHSDHGGGKGKGKPKRGRRSTRWGKNPKKDAIKNKNKNASRNKRDEPSGDTRITLPVAKFVSTQQTGKRKFPLPPSHYVDATEKVFKQSTSDHVEYDVDDEDVEWLALINARRRKAGQRLIELDVFESAMDLLEHESFRSAVALGQQQEEPFDDEAVCSICLFGDCENLNAILFCDGCNVPVHQECYGVPNVPEGTWYCRKCDYGQSDTTCSMCPMPGGALKQSDDGTSFAHVQCVLWIPELTFGNAQLRDPIFGLKNVDTKRTKELTCYICRQKKRGACIQCYDKRCFQAFHVTCAQEAGLGLHLGDVLDGKDSTVSAFCHQHIPTWYSKEVCADRPLISSTHTGGLKKDVAGMKKRRMQLMGASTKNNVTGNVPPVKPDVLHTILTKHRFSERELEVAKQIRQYWLLKRRSRSGVPLLRSLKGNANSVMSQRADAIQKERKKFHYIRRMLEKTRMLVGQVHRRERLKQDVLQNMTDVFLMKALPLRYILNHALDSICRRDTEEVFAEPVDATEYPSYSSFVSTPMHTSLMRQHLHSGYYGSFAKFVADFQLMCENCMRFNGDPNSWYHQYALDMLHAGNAILEATGELLAAVPMDPTTGALVKVDGDLVSPLGHALDVVYDIPQGVFDVLREQQPVSSVVLSDLIVTVDAETGSTSAVVIGAHCDDSVGTMTAAEVQGVEQLSSDAPCPNGRPDTDSELSTAHKDTMVCASGQDDTTATPPVSSLPAGSEDPIKDAPEDPGIGCPIETAPTRVPAASAQSPTCTGEPISGPIATAHTHEQLDVELTGPVTSTEERTVSPHVPLAPAVVGNGHVASISTGDSHAPKLSVSAVESGRTVVPTVLPLNGAREEDFDRVVFGLAKEMLDARRQDTTAKRASKFKRIGHLLRCYRNKHFDELPEKYQKLAGIDIEKKMQLKREEAAAMAAKEKEDNLVLLAGHVCWAKATGFPWYPSLLVDPADDSADSEAPNASVLANGPPKHDWAPLDGTRCEAIDSNQKFLLKFFDKKSSWAWLDKTKIKMMFLDDKLDKKLLSAVKKSSQKADLKNAFQLAEDAHRRSRSKLKARKEYT